MALTKPYPEDFERLWLAYPSWPKGRSVKKLAYEAYLKAKKRNEWGAGHVDELLEEIESQKALRKSWQPGDKYGPQAMQVWFNQQGWEHDYPRREKGKLIVGTQAVETEWGRRGMSQAEWDAEQDWLGRQQLNMPQQYATKEEAIAAAALRELANGTRH